METCHRTIIIKGWNGGRGHLKRKCGRPAPTHRTPSGLPVCEYHYRKRLAAEAKKTTREKGGER